MQPARIASAAFVLLGGLLALAGCKDTSSRLQEARAAIAATLPAPYFEDLVTESVSVDGDRLVLVVRSPAGDADRTRAAPGFDTLRASEQQEMARLCTLPAVKPLIGTDARLVRRFVDRHDKLFFEVELPARECAVPSA